MEAAVEGLLRRLEKESRREGIPAIDERDGFSLAALAFTAPRGGLVLDLGAGIGYSTAWLALGAGPWRGRVVAVEGDPRRASRLREFASEISEATGAEVEVVEGDALSYLESLGPGTVSLAFVDIEKHEYTRALQMLAGSDGPRRLLEGGLAAFHNAYFPAPPPEFFREASKYETVTIPTPAGLLVVRL